MLTDHAKQKIQEAIKAKVKANEGIKSELLAAYVMGQYLAITTEQYNELLIELMVKGDLRELLFGDYANGLRKLIFCGDSNLVIP